MAKKNKEVVAQDVIALDEEELVGLKEFDKKLADLKNQLADTYIQSRSVEENLTKLADSVNQVRLEYINAAKAVAKTHGVDMDIPNQGNWSLNLNDKTLTKTN